MGKMQRGSSAQYLGRDDTKMAPCTLISSCISLLGKELSLSCSAALSKCTGFVGPALRAFSSSTDRPPKKPLNAYMLYAQQQRPLIVAQCPGLSVLDVTRKVAQRWKEQTTEQKRPYVDASAAAMQQYYAEMEKYKVQFTQDQSALLEKKKQENMAKKEARKKKSELKSLGKPKRPRTAVNIFMTEHFGEAKGKTVAAKMKALMDIWKNLYAAQKQVYLQLAEDDRIRYKGEMMTWEEKMIKMGREDLIRKKSTGAKRSREENKRTKSLE